jgi:hypothetical protein
VNGSQTVTTTTTTTRSTGSTSGNTGGSSQSFISTAQPQLQTTTLPTFQSTYSQVQPQLQTQSQQYPTFGLQGGFQQTTTTISQQQQQQQLQQQQQQFRDPNCNQFAPNSNQCIRCATRYYINNQSGLCTAIAGQCSSYDQNTGACQGCYPGFVFMNG